MNISKKVHLLKPHISVLHVTHMVHFACRQVKNPQLWGDNVERGLKLEYDIWVVVMLVGFVMVFFFIFLFFNNIFLMSC